MGGNQIAEDIGGWRAIILGGILLVFFLFSFLFTTALVGFPIWKYLLGGVIIILLFFLRKRLFGPSRHHSENMFSIKTFIIYGLAFTIGYWISTIVMPYIKTTNIYVIFLIAGLCLELSSKMAQIFLYNKNYITLNSKFVLWVLIHSVLIYGVLFLINKVSITNYYLQLLAIGFSIALITQQVIWRLMYK